MTNFFLPPRFVEKTGIVQGWAAILMGIMSGSIPWYTMMVLHKKVWFLKQVDDTMAVFHTHAVAGSLGGILSDIFANPKLCRIFYLTDDWQHYIGLAYGLQSGKINAGFKQIGVQLLGILFIVVLHVFTTSVICLLIRLVVPLRLSEEELQSRDDAIHGEEAYALWGDVKVSSVYGADVDDFPLIATKGAEVQMV